MGLVSERKTNKIIDLDDIVPVKNSKVDLTRAKYLKLKRANKTDKEIAQMCNVAPGTIQNWKKANGIVTERIQRKRYKKNVN